jgi:predicted nucleotidyltransferase
MNLANTNNISVHLTRNKSSAFVINKLKEIVLRYDNNAEIILFGSHARGDWNEESDWDFLILSKYPEHSDIKEKIRRDILNEIELIISEVVFILMHNKKVWEEDYAVTPLYYNIEEEGIVIT